MRATIRRSSLQGTLRAPPSKSDTHRAMFCAALAQGESKLNSALFCDDTLGSSEALSKIGVAAKWVDDNACVIQSSGRTRPSGVIFCRESGTTLRFMTAVCATTPYEAEITGGSSLLRRPMKDLILALRELGASCTSDGGYPPVRVKGPMKGGSVKILGNVSSQYISALLLAAPLAETAVEIFVLGRLESKSYVQMTLHMQSKFGVRVHNENLTEFRAENGAYRPCILEVEGDWSSAASFLVGTAIAGEKVEMTNLAQETFQADRYLLQVLERIGGRIRWNLRSITVEKSELKPLDVDVSDCPDLFPALCALVASTEGVSTIRGIRRLRIKESNRVLAMSDGLKKMGIMTEESEDSLIIYGRKPHGATIDPYRDHRIAMAFATLGLCTDETTIVDAECVGKSYPTFWSDLQSLGVEVTLH